jgi:hypothetical protein
MEASVFKLALIEQVTAPVKGRQLTLASITVDSKLQLPNIKIINITLSLWCRFLTSKMQRVL